MSFFVCLFVCLDIHHILLSLFAVVALKAQFVMSLLLHHQRDRTRPEAHLI